MTPQKLIALSNRCSVIKTARKPDCYIDSGDPAAGAASTLHTLYRLPGLWGGEGGSNPPLNFQKNCIVCLQNILSKPCSYVHEIQNFIQENVRNCTLISHFSSASRELRLPGPLPGLCPWTPLGDLRRAPGPAAHHVNPLHCKMLGTPMARPPLENSL